MPPKHILKVSACFSKCPGSTQNQANLPVLIYNFATTKSVLLPGLELGSKNLLPPKKMMNF